MISKELLSEVLGLTFIPATGKELLEHSFGYAQGIRTACVRPLKDDEWITIKDNVLTFGFIDLRPEVAKNIPDGVYTSRSINIYELAHKCKEWAGNLKFNIVALNTMSDFKRWKCAVLQKTGERYPINCRNGYIYEGDLQNIVISGFSQITENYFAYTEPEAVFQACQWILDNKDK